MVQGRVKSGKDFEKNLVKSLNSGNNNWVVVDIKPKMNWSGVGRGIIQKIKSINYDPSLLTLTECSNLSKWDIENTLTGEKREVKKYNLDDLKSWKLYSEPYFKIANRPQVSKISVDVYKNFIESFYKINTDNGFFNRVIEDMLLGISGVQIEDAFIPISNLDFRTVLIPGWLGYQRITIQFKLKD